MAEEGSCNFLATIAPFCFVFCSCCCSSIVGISSAEDIVKGKTSRIASVGQRSHPSRVVSYSPRQPNAVTHTCRREYDIEGSELKQARKRRYF